MYSKFDLRQMAFQLTPLKSKEDALKKVKEKVAELKLSDTEAIEFIKQLNTASQYGAFKTAEFKLDAGANFDAVLLNPTSTFKELSKTAGITSLGSEPTQVGYFNRSRLQQNNKAKVANLQAEEKTFSTIEALNVVKKASLEDEEAWDALKRVKRDTKQQKISTLHTYQETIQAFETLVHKYAYLENKYNQLVPEKSQQARQKAPTATEVVKATRLYEKLASLTTSLTNINLIESIVGE